MTAEMTIDWSKAVRVDGGGYMRLEDFCNSTGRGSELHFTTGAVTMDEELLGHECGWRVANNVIEYALTGWDALVEMSYEWIRGEE